MSFLGFGVAVQPRDAHDARELELALDGVARDVEHRGRAFAVRAVKGAMDDRPRGLRDGKHQANSVIDGGGLPDERCALYRRIIRMRADTLGYAASEGGREKFR
jgi:hypothetical protein